MRQFATLTVLVVSVLNFDLVLAGTADPSIKFGTPTYGGRGCAPGTLAFAMDPSDDTFSVIYDDFKVEVGPGRDADVMECSALIPISIPPRTRMEIVQADYRGFRYLPIGSIGEFSSLFRFGSNENKRSERKLKFKGFVSDEFLETHTQPISSRCGGNEVLKVDMRLFLKANDHQEQAFIELDTKDVTEATPPNPGSAPIRNPGRNEGPGLGRGGGQVGRPGAGVRPGKVPRDQRFRMRRFHCDR